VYGVSVGTPLSTPADKERRNSIFTKAAHIAGRVERSILVLASRDSMDPGVGDDGAPSARTLAVSRASSGLSIFRRSSLGKLHGSAGEGGPQAEQKQNVPENNELSYSMKAPPSSSRPVDGKPMEAWGSARAKEKCTVGAVPSTAAPPSGLKLLKQRSQGRMMKRSSRGGGGDARGARREGRGEGPRDNGKCSGLGRVGVQMCTFCVCSLNLLDAPSDGRARNWGRVIMLLMYFSLGENHFNFVCIHVGSR